MDVFGTSVSPSIVLSADSENASLVNTSLALSCLFNLSDGLRGG